MRGLYENFKYRYFTGQPDFRARLFNVLALSGITISFFTLIESIFTEMWGIAVIGVSLMVLSYGIMSYASRSGNYVRCYYITIFAVFLVFFPVLFFFSGGYHGGMPSVIIFAVLFTMLMLSGWQAFAMMALEIAVYIGVTWVCYYFPELVTNFSGEEYVLKDIQFGFSSVAMACGIVVFLHLREYDRQRDQLKDKNEMLKRMDEAKSAFLNTVAHEVRNPLNIISLHAQDTKELAQEEFLDLEQIRENQQIISDTVKRMDGILSDLMDTVSIEQGRLTLSPAPILLEEVIKASAAPWEKQFSLGRTDTEIKLSLEEGLPPLCADYLRIYQVLSNLIINSYRHTKKGTVTVSLKNSPEGQQVCVTDNGEGMDEEMRKKALEGYVSEDKDYWRHGIGLYVCNRVIKAHGGNIWIESKKGCGTSVCFTLPQKEEN